MARTRSEIGAVGLPIFSGRISLDPNVRLRGAQAIQIYRQMLYDEPSAAAFMTVVMHMLRTDLYVEPAGSTDNDKRAAEFLETCLDDMRHSVKVALRQMASMVWAGWSINEIVYKRRNGGRSTKYDDGRVGWAAWPLRRQESLYRWQTEGEYTGRDTGRVIGFEQRPAPDYRLRKIPFEKKAIHLVADDTEGSPEGKSALRGMYRQYYYVTNFELLMAISLERFGTGMPVFSRVDEAAAPLSDEQQATLESIAAGIRQNEEAYVLEPPGIKFRLEESPGLDAEVYIKAIQMMRTWALATVQAEFIALGTNSVGSYALGDSKIDLFLLGMNGYQDRMSDGINQQAVRPLFKMNDFGKLTDYPRVKLPAVKEYDLQKLGSFVKIVNALGAFHVTPEDEALFRKIADLPEVDKDVLQEMHDADNDDSDEDEATDMPPQSIDNDDDEMDDVAIEDDDEEMDDVA